MNFNIRYQFVTIFIFFSRLCQLIGLIGLLLLSSRSQIHKISVSHFLLHSGYWIQLRLNVREYRASVRSSSSYRSCRCTSTTRTTATVRTIALSGGKIEFKLFIMFTFVANFVDILENQNVKQSMIAANHFQQFQFPTCIWRTLGGCPRCCSPPCGCPAARWSAPRAPASGPAS